MWMTCWENSLVPRYWMHNYEIKNMDEKTLKDMMIDNKMPVP